MRYQKLYLLALLLLAPFAFSFAQMGGSTTNAHVITYLPYSPCVGSPVLFTATDTTGQYTQAYHWWSFGDGSSGSSSFMNPSVSHVYTAAGTYTVHVGAWDSLTQSVDSVDAIYVTVDSTCLNHDMVSGSVYVDANSNGSLDGGEVKIPGALIQITPGPFYMSTDVNGDYALNLPTGSYTIALQPIMYHNYVNPATGSLSFTSTGSSAVSTGNDFGVQPIANQQDLRVQVYAAPPVPGFQRSYYISYQNVGTTIASGTVELDFDPALTVANANGGTVTGNTISWNYGTLMPGAYGSTYAILQVPSTLTLGTLVNFTARINPIPSDVVPADNVDTLTQTVVGSYDPNDKQVSPAGEGPAGNIALGTDDLTYTVRFQNTGTFYATDVVIRDTLDADLDRMTVEVLGSSHPMSWYLNQNELVFEFRNIMLPDSNTDEPGSHGWLRYSIDPKAGLPLGSEFTNSAAIYFDFNAPIITNTTLNTFANLVGMAPALNMLNPVSIAPHPVGSMATVRFSNPNAEVHTFSLMDLNGKVVRHMEGITSSEFVLDRAELPAGLYIYRLDNAQAQAVSIGRLVVQ